MPRISVVIPVYQYADACLACLTTLTRQTRLPDEIVVVDDGSTDGLKDKIAPLLKTYPLSLRFFRFEENRGAPAARNEGARHVNGEYIIFLDPDTDLSPSFFERFEKTLEEHPEVDIVYSAYNFGWNFSFVPFSPERLKQTNFIHMNSLLRRSAFPGFDESLKKFQDWDLWLTMVEHGSVALGIPDVLFDVAPRATGYSQWLPSFVYTLPWKKLGWAPKVVKKYHIAEQIIRSKHHLAEAKTFKNEALPLYLKTILLPFVSLIVLEALSFLVVFHPKANTVVSFLLGMAMFFCAFFRPVQALGFLGAEYATGSKGALFKAFGNPVNDGGISLRIILFCAFFAGWGIQWLRAGQWKEMAQRLWRRGEYIALGVVLGAAFINGVVQKNLFVFADANAWGFLLLLLPVLDLARRATKQQIQTFITWIVAALLWSVTKTLGLFYAFSHAFPAWFLEPLYLWVRRTGVGEITRAGGNIFRIFFQSHIYGLLLLPGLLLVQRFKRSRLSFVLVGFSVLFFAQTLVSLSRSFFLGLCVSGVLAAVFAWRMDRIQGVVRLGGRFLATACAAMALVASICFFPIPHSDSSLLNAWQSRMSAGDDASASRWKLLPAMWQKIAEHPMIGSGFGATVTYTSRDPRVVQTTGGTYTTYAFEWGWLEHWIKLGILGIPLLLLILGRLIQRLLRSELPREYQHLFILSIVALAVVHISTPYLNHPLGFAWLIVMEGIAEHAQTR